MRTCKQRHNDGRLRLRHSVLARQGEHLGQAADRAFQVADPDDRARAGTLDGADYLRGDVVTGRAGDAAYREHERRGVGRQG
jgi:hypothetical protein